MAHFLLPFSLLFFKRIKTPYGLGSTSSRLEPLRRSNFLLKAKFPEIPIIFQEGVYVTIVHPAFSLFLYFPGVHFRDELQHGGDVSQQKIKCQPIRTREIGGVSLSDVLYVK